MEPSLGNSAGDVQESLDNGAYRDTNSDNNNNHIYSNNTPNDSYLNIVYFNE